MKYLLFLFTVLFLSSCNTIDTTTPSEKRILICTCEELDRVRDDVKESLLPSNNYSDEEMEDVIHQLERTFVRLNCQQRLVKGFGTGLHFKPTLDSCMNSFETHKY